MERPIPVIIGPTAVGKTDLSLDLARELEAEIIGGDSRQLYRFLDIGTAKPSPAQRRLVPHHLIDIVNPDVTMHAAGFARMAWGCIHSIEASGKLPLVVGGSGLYIRALTDGLFAGPGANPHLRTALAAEAHSLGLQALHDRLAAVDQAAAQRIHPHDRVRIIRALEIYALTGKPISQWQCQWQHPGRQRAFVLIGLTRDREDLRRRIAARTEAMLRMGLESEVRTVLAMGYPPTLPTLQSVGYREIVAYLDGKWDLAHTRELIEHHTWRLAKQQMTWFRHVAGVQWVSLTDPPANAAIRIIKDLVGRAEGLASQTSPDTQHQDRGERCTCPTLT
ncbi:MAG TPA: tRNA (adenosine(37)-N6)-dimethylallyltransferase MiaA [Candidatus Tectomicrobia bacterium]|nr:tRNA (adenosine(37)-N6)-dimethylallyltransferase MiaA [Candidatus Tectomicrobia bacterium]